MSLIVFLVGVMLATLLTLPFLVGQGNVFSESFDPFTPARLAAGLNLIFTVPYLLVASADPTIISGLVRYHRSVDSLDLAIARFGLTFAIGFAAQWIGTSAKWPEALAGVLPRPQWDETPVRIGVALTFGVAVGGGAILYLVYIVGGLDVLMANLGRRIELVAGLGVIVYMRYFLMLGAMLAVYALRYNRSSVRIIIALVTVTMALMVLSLFGGRTHAVQLIILVMLTWHYAVAPMRHFGRNLVLSAAIITPYVIAIPIIRSSAGEPAQLLSTIRNAQAAGRAFVQEVGKGTDTYILVVNHFDRSNAWLGKSFLDLRTALVPSTSLYGKPPIDEGMYIQTIALGRHVTPPLSRHDLWPSAWPPETFGTMYANFLLPGVLLGMYLLGALQRVLYSYLRNSATSFFAVALYGFAMVTAQLSNIRLVQMGSILATTTLLCALFLAPRWSTVRRD